MAQRCPECGYVMRYVKDLNASGKRPVRVPGQHLQALQEDGLAIPAQLVTWRGPDAHRSWREPGSVR